MGFLLGVCCETSLCFFCLSEVSRCFEMGLIVFFGDFRVKPRAAVVAGGVGGCFGVVCQVWARSFCL